MSSSPSVSHTINSSQTEELRQLLNQDDKYGEVIVTNDEFDPSIFLASENSTDGDPTTSNGTFEHAKNMESSGESVMMQDLLIVENGNLNNNDIEKPFDEDIFNTLESINSTNADMLYPYFVAYNVGHHQIKYLNESNLKTIIPLQQQGFMAEFRHKLEQWKLTQIDSINLVENSNFAKNSNKCLLDIIQGNKILEKKVNKTSLTNNDSKILLNIIKDHYQNNCDNKMRTSDIERLSKEIAIVFPGEKSESYFTRVLTKHVAEDGKVTYKSRPTGTLLFKWNNRALKGAEKKKLLEKGHIEMSVPLMETEIVDENIQANLKEALQKAKQKPLDLPRDWASCRQIRIKFLLENQNKPLEILKEWPSYGWPEGNLLVISKNMFLNLF